MTPTDSLTSIARVYPTAWRQADEMRADRGHGLPDWEPQDAARKYFEE